GLGETKLHQLYQALAAGEDARAFALSQQLHGFLDRLGCAVVERRRLHRAAPSRYSVARSASPVCGTESPSRFSSGSRERSSVATSGQSSSTRLPAGSRTYICTLPSGSS